jgi:hypothetical protein
MTVVGKKRSLTILVSIPDSLDGRQFYLLRNVSYLGVFLVSRILFGGDLNRGPGGKPARVLHRTLPVSRVPNVGKLTSIKGGWGRSDLFYLCSQLVLAARRKVAP